jgi:hypothetical protein
MRPRRSRCAQPWTTASLDQLPCYLETENRRNVAFYVKQGFDLIVSGEEVDTSGLRFWTFRRSPQR